MKSIFKMKVRYLPSLFFSLIAIIIMFAPYQPDSTLFGGRLHDILIIVVYILLALMLIFLLPNFKRKDLGKSSVLAMVPAILLMIMNAVHSYGNAELNGLITILWIIFCLFPKDIKKITFVFFKRMWCLMCLIGIICFACYILNAPLSYENVPFYYSGSTMSYINYGVSFLYKQNNVLRLCGICNEPGYLGTFCALILCASGMKLKKIDNIIIFIAGVLSSSLAFVLIMIVYFILKITLTAHKEKSLRKKILRYLCTFVLAFSYVVILPNIKTDNSAVDNMIQRMTLTSEGLSGDNRTTERFDELYNSLSFLDLSFGMGRGYLQANGIDQNLSYKIYIVEYGLFCCILVYGILLVAVLYKNTKNTPIVIFVIVFFVSIYQRPTVITPSYAILLLGGIEYIKSRQNIVMLEDKNENK